MEIMLQTVIIVFMLFLCSLCLFAVLVIARDMVAESLGKRKSVYTVDSEQLKEQLIKEMTIIKDATPKESEELPAPPPKIEPIVYVPPVAVEEKAPEIVVEPAPVAEEALVLEEPASETDDGNAVKFSTTQLTMQEKYAMLSKEHKGYFDAIVKHALSKEGAKANLAKNYYDYKIGATKLIRMSIKRGEIVCEFVFIDRDFKNYASQVDLKFKSSGTMIRVTEPAAVGVAKDGIDLVYSQMLEEREYKKQQAREKRRARRQAQNAEADSKETANVG